MENIDDKKTSRASQTREKTSRPKVWAPPSSLDEPAAQAAYNETDYAVVQDGKYKGVIGQGGLVLARVSVEIAKQYADYYRKQAQDNENAFDNDLLKEEHPSMPISVDRNTRVTFGGTKK